MHHVKWSRAWSKAAFEAARAEPRTWAAVVITIMTQKMPVLPAGGLAWRSGAQQPGLPRDRRQAPWIGAGSEAQAGPLSLAWPAFSAARGIWFSLLPGEPGERESLVSAACRSRARAGVRLLNQQQIKMFRWCSHTPGKPDPPSPP